MDSIENAKLKDINEWEFLSDIISSDIMLIPNAWEDISFLQLNSPRMLAAHRKICGVKLYTNDRSVWKIDLVLLGCTSITHEYDAEPTIKFLMEYYYKVYSDTPTFTVGVDDEIVCKACPIPKVGIVDHKIHVRSTATGGRFGAASGLSKEALAGQAFSQKMWDARFVA